MKRNERGVTILVVLMLLAVMLLGGLAFARLTHVSTLASGNTAYREASIQVSEIGLNTVFQRIRDDVVDENADIAGWYWSQAQATDANGVPVLDLDAAPSLSLDPYTVSYVAERLCSVAAVTDPLRQCLVKQVPQPNASRLADREALDPPTARQYRATVRISGPKGTQTWVQSLITKG